LLAAKKLKLALLFGGRSAEHEVAILSARSIIQALDKNKYDIYPLAISRTGKFLSLAESKNILQGKQKNIPDLSRKSIITAQLIEFLTTEIELVFPVLHGPYGEDGKIQGFLDTLNLNYIGCQVEASVLGMDKAIMKKIFAYHKIPQAKFSILEKNYFDSADLEKLYQKYQMKLGMPCFVKPANMGSSIGINKINGFASFKSALKDAFTYDQKVILESYIEAREVESAVLETADQLVVSAAGEIISDHDFYDYQAKYKSGNSKLLIPAPISASVQSKIKQLSRQAFKAIGARGISRLDFFITEKKEVLVNEINTMPGFTEFSMYPLLFKEAGLEYSQLLDKLITMAMAADN
jgi:D-alanine-D-alanine ligase